MSAGIHATNPCLKPRNGDPQPRRADAKTLLCRLIAIVAEYGAAIPQETPTPAFHDEYHDPPGARLRGPHFRRGAGRGRRRRARRRAVEQILRGNRGRLQRRCRRTHLHRHRRRHRDAAARGPYGKRRCPAAVRGRDVRERSQCRQHRCRVRRDRPAGGAGRVLRPGSQRQPADDHSARVGCARVDRPQHVRRQRHALRVANAQREDRRPTWASADREFDDADERQVCRRQRREARHDRRCRMGTAQRTRQGRSGDCVSRQRFVVRHSCGDRAAVSVDRHVRCRLRRRFLSRLEECLRLCGKQLHRHHRQGAPSRSRRFPV